LKRLSTIGKSTSNKWQTLESTPNTNVDTLLEFKVKHKPKKKEKQTNKQSNEYQRTHFAKTGMRGQEGELFGSFNLLKLTTETVLTDDIIKRAKKMEKDFLEQNASKPADEQQQGGPDGATQAEEEEVEEAPKFRIEEAKDLHLKNENPGEEKSDIKNLFELYAPLLLLLLCFSCFSLFLLTWVVSNREKDLEDLKDLPNLEDESKDDDNIKKLLKKAGVIYSHLNTEMVGESEWEKRLGEKAAADLEHQMKLQKDFEALEQIRNNQAKAPLVIDMRKRHPLPTSFESHRLSVRDFREGILSSSRPVLSQRRLAPAGFVAIPENEYREWAEYQLKKQSEMSATQDAPVVLPPKFDIPSSYKKGSHLVRSQSRAAPPSTYGMRLKMSDTLFNPNSNPPRARTPLNTFQSSKTPSPSSLPVTSTPTTLPTVSTSVPSPSTTPPPPLPLLTLPPPQVPSPNATVSPTPQREIIELD
jgi:hypothetical protein